MKYIILSVLLCVSFLQAKTIEATYKISYGIFGELGKAHTTLELFDDKTYLIRVKAYATGLAKVLSANKKETYESHGIILDNQLIPHKFTKVASNDYKYRSKVYTFDHKTKKITLNKLTKRLLTKHNSSLEPIQTWKESRSSSHNKFFAENDLLSLFFNLQHIIPNFAQGQHYSLKAIGANKKDGQLDISIPSGKKYDILQKALKTDDIKFIAAINQKIFSSKKGKLFISLNKDGFCNKAVLKDVLMFGDIRGEMITFNIKENE